LSSSLGVNADRRLRFTAAIRVYDAASIVTEMHESTRAISESREVLTRIALRFSLKQFSNDSAFVGLLPIKRPDYTK